MEQVSRRAMGILVLHVVTVAVLCTVMVGSGLRAAVLGGAVLGLRTCSAHMLVGRTQPSVLIGAKKGAKGEKGKK